MLHIPTDLPLIVSLIGARRSGKTYLLYTIINQLIKIGISPKRIIYLNFEDERLNLQTADLDLILQAYSIDTGMLSAIEFSVSENRGKLLENMVLLEFIKSGYEVFYFKEKYECDFVVKKENVFQVFSWTIDNDKTRDREIRGLIEVCAKLNVEVGTILTFDQKDEFVQQGIKIKFVPAYQYFLWEVSEIPESTN